MYIGKKGKTSTTVWKGDTCNDNQKKGLELQPIIATLVHVGRIFMRFKTVLIMCIIYATYYYGFKFNNGI